MKKLQLFLIFLLLSGIGFGGLNTPVPAISAVPGQSVNSPASLTGPTSVCLNSTGNVYITDAGQTNYVWSITGGTITAGGTTADNTATVTWTAAGAKSITVNYDGATATVLPVTVNPLTSSISIAASATSVYTGTSVTFTATPVNGGTSPAYQWKVNGNNMGTNSNVFSYTPLNGDAIYCILTPNAPCITSSFTSSVITITVTNKPLIITIPTLTATPGQTILFPVKLIGANTSGTPISSANIQISYDPAVMTYDTIINFYSGAPSSQWFFSGNNSAVSANWIEPSLLTLSIPDNTTLFEIQFTYIGGTSALPFTLYELTDVLYNFVTTNHIDGAVSPVLAVSPGYLACDFHQHTTYTDGSYSFSHVMQKNNQYGLSWWANSEHGGAFNRDATFSGTDLGATLYWDSFVPNPIIGTVNISGGHQNMWRWQSLRDYSFQNTQIFRALYTTKKIFQSYELNVPGHEHASLGIINNQFNVPPDCNPLAEFEFKFDASDADVTGGVAQGWTKSALGNVHVKAIEAITWLQTNYPSTSYLVAAHPERKSLNNIQGFRDMNTAGPDVCFGFESMPGHQKATDRGEYKTSYNTYGTSTYGGCGIYAAKVGGLWDAMLSEGRHWWLFASSDFHAPEADFYPGEYQKTYAYVSDRNNPQSYIDALRSGNSFVVEGDLIDSLDFKVGNAPVISTYATIGQTFTTVQTSVVVKIKVRDPQWNNNNTYSAYTNPAVNHIDLIKGKVGSMISPVSPAYSVDTVATSAVIARFDAVGGVVSANGIVSQAWTDLGGGLKEITYTYNNLVDSVYFRLRGTNNGLNVANETDANGNPLTDALMAPNNATKAFADLWFYSNPIFVAGPVSPALTGPATVCQGSTGNLYTTDAAQTNYIWTVSGGTITAGGGSADNTVTITWPSAGNHSVSVAYSGSATTTLPVTVSTPVVASSTAGTITCAGGTTTVTVSATGGTPPYTGTGDFILGAGTYSFTVTDVNGCSGITTVTITEPPLFTLKSNISSTNGAEISAFDSASKRIYTVAGPVMEYYALSNAGVLSSPTTVPLGFTPPAGTTAVPNSVAVRNGVVAASYAIVGANNAQQQGRVAFYAANTAAYISNVTVGYLPDMLAFTPDGTKILTANEGEPNSYGQPTSFDPEGSVSIIDISGGVASPTVTNAGFTSFNGQLATLKAAGVRIYGPGATVAMDLEPEYLTFSPDGTTAYITLQENNAIGKLNIATATITNIYPLGLKDHGLAGNGLDASDRDVNGTAGGGGKINMQNWPIKGMYEPDGIATFTTGTTTYYITANEGDSRAYTGFSEEVRVGDASYVLDPAVFPNAATLKLPVNLGRLQLTNATGNTDGDAEFEEIHAFGARSFTIWNSSFTKVFDSQDQLEKITSVRNAAGYNSDGTAASFDSRSDNKGPEPEGIAIGTVNGVQYAFIGSERTGDIFVYDLSNPLAPVLRQYINTPADLGVEGVQFVSAGQSPTGKALLITSAEVSKTVSVYEFSAAPVITLLGNATEQVCQNSQYIDAGATAVDYLGNNITGSIVPTSTVNTAVPGTYTVTYNVTDACGIAALPVTRTIIVNPTIVVSVSIVASANPVCANTSVTFTATPVNGGAPAAYQWKKNGSNISGATDVTYTYVPVNNDAITCVLTSNASPCASGSPATSNAIAMTVYPLTASISIAASANPVMAGTPVTFTATVANGGPAPSFQWKVNNTVIAGNSSAVLTYTPENGDVIICILTSNAPCVTSLFTSNVINMTVNYPVGSLLVTLPNKTAMPGDVLYYPVKLKGASASGTPISAANIQITYDPAVLHYDTLVNFYAGMPATQWFYSGNLNTVAANWQEPGLNALAVPDSTTLFEIKFTYLGGTGILPFTVNEFTNAIYDLIPTNHINGGVAQLVPTNNTVQNVTVAASHDTCFSAIQVITVAGDGTTFDVQNGGSATFVAGQQISFMPGTMVVPGGYLHGYITLNGQYCGQLPNPVVAAQVVKEETTSIPEITSNQSIRVYPNPTNGMFTVEVKGDSQAIMTKAEIYSMSGLKVHTEILNNERKHEFSMPELTSGMYFIHVSTNQRSETLKIVKL